MRLFAAVNLPAAEKARLASVVDDLRRALLPLRFVEPDSLHITLKFFGEVNELRKAAVVEAMREGTRGAEPFELHLGGFGTFPSRGPARVLWTGVERSAPLERLNLSLEQAFERIGFAREQRGFQPHITLARATTRSRAVYAREVDRIAGDIVYNAVVPVRSVDLMRSHLSARGAQYERIDEIELRGV